MLKNPRRLLIIDDDVDFVTLLVDYFTLEGFDTVPAAKRITTALKGLLILRANHSIWSFST